MGRSLVAGAFALLLVVLLVTFVYLYRSTKGALVSGFQRVQEDALKAELAAPLSTLLARANAVTTTFANRSEVRIAAALRDRMKRVESGEGEFKNPQLRQAELQRIAESFVALDSMLMRLVDERFVRSLRILDGDGEVVSELNLGAARVSGGLAALARPPLDQEDLRLAADAGMGTIRYAFQEGAGGPILRALTGIDLPNNRVGALVLEFDASGALRFFLGAREGSNLAGATVLLDENGTQLYPDPASNETLRARFDRTQFAGITGGPDGSQRLGGTLVSVSSFNAAGRRRWRVVAALPESDIPARLEGGYAWTLGLAALAVFLVFVVASTVGQGFLREENSRQEAVYLLRSLEEKERSERFLDSVFNAITDVIVIQDTDYNIIRANRVAREVYGGEVRGRKCYEVYRNKSSMNCKDCPVEETVRTGRPHSTEMRHPVTGEVWQINDFPLFDDQGRVHQVVEHARNVTAQKRLEAKLIQSEKLSTLGEMAAGIAHEINNPVGVVSMFAQLATEELKEHEELGDLRDKVAVIEEHSQQIGKIVKDLLQFARKSEGQRALVPVESILERAFTIVELKKMSQSVEIERGSGAGFMVYVDEGQLAQVVLNLMVNALHAMDGEGDLAVSVERAPPGSAPPLGIPAGDLSEEASSQERIRIAVRDSGPGIKDEDLRRIFDPFFTTKEAGQGTGLGLSVSFGIIRDHGGMIYIDSRPGYGACFTIDLPSGRSPDAGRSQRLRAIEV